LLGTADEDSRLEKGLADAVVDISDSAVITCSSEWSINPFTNPYPVERHEE
jgi:hypothetical protein